MSTPPTLLSSLPRAYWVTSAVIGVTSAVIETLFGSRLPVEEELFPYREDPAAYLLEAAHGLHNAYLENERVIERRELVFRLALLALGAETLLWALALALS
jgi:hypothetical protein